MIIFLKQELLQKVVLVSNRHSKDCDRLFCVPVISQNGNGQANPNYHDPQLIFHAKISGQYDK